MSEIVKPEVGKVHDGFHLYFAGNADPASTKYMEERNCLRLLSYYHEKKFIEEWMGMGHSIFVDSGAFSAHTRGAEIDLDAYIQYVNERDENIIIFAELDKIPGTYRKPKTRQELMDAPEISWNNYLYMRERLTSHEKCLPVFHQGEDFQHLVRMLEYSDSKGNIPYIGISPANDQPLGAKEAWSTRAFEVIKKSNNPNVKTHAFGLTALPVLERVPFFSADSTRWVIAAAMGKILSDYSDVSVSDQSIHNADNIIYMPKDIQAELKRQVEEAGFDLERLKTEYLYRRLWNIKYLQDWADKYKYKEKKASQATLF